MDNTNLNSQNLESTSTNERQEDEEEEIISLRDFSLNTDEIEKSNFHPSNHTQQTRRSASEPSDFFEFFNNFSSMSHNMSHAEDIILHGQLIPYEPLPGMNRTRTNSNLTRSTRSLDREKVARRRHGTTKSRVSDLNLNFSRKVDQGLVVKVSTKPRWYLLMFLGLMRFPQEMDIQDIKNRQVRRRRSRIYDVGGGGGGSTRGSEGWWGHDLLRVLSCKSRESVAIDVTSAVSSC